MQPKIKCLVSWPHLSTIIEQRYRTCTRSGRKVIQSFWYQNKCLQSYKMHINATKIAMAPQCVFHRQQANGRKTLKRSFHISDLHLSAPCSIISLWFNIIKKMLLKLVVSLDVSLSSWHGIIPPSHRRISACKWIHVKSRSSSSPDLLVSTAHSNHGEKRDHEMILLTREAV